jgi:hypothetical protein
LIKLTFRPVCGETPVLVRATYFRICADRTLRGPDNGISASYSHGVWRLGLREHRGFDCDGPVYLRVCGRDGHCQHIGPYDSLRAMAGAIFTHETRLGVHAPSAELGALSEVWHEIVLLRPQSDHQAPLGLY